MTAYAVPFTDEGSAMLQAPPDPVPWNKVLIGAVGAVVGWLLKSMLMSSFKEAVLNAVSAELDKRFKAHEEHMDHKLDEKIERIREEAQIERRGLRPR